MSNINTSEQAVAIIDATTKAVEAAQPEPTNYWWLLIIAVVPGVIIWWLKKRG